MKRIIIYVSSIILLTVFTSVSHAQDSGTFRDSRDNNTYKWVKIGSQIWMAENLDYAVGRGSAQYGNIYGRMYNWETAKRVCPSGWHLPSDSEWMQLERAVGMSAREVNQEYRDRHSGDAGLKLKSRTGWKFYMQKGNGIDKYGFNALPGGYYQAYNKKFMYYGSGISFWSSTSADRENAIYRELGSHYNGIDRDQMYKVHGCYVRCVKD